MAQLRTDNQRLAGELATARADLRAERRKSKDLSNQLLVAADRLDTAGVHGAIAMAPPPRLPIEVLSPDDLSENGSLVGDDGSDVVYVGDAAGPSVELDLGEDARPRPSRAPSTPRTAPRDLDALPTAAELAAPRPSIAPPADNDAALELYRTGQTALRARDHAAAIDAFRALIARYPRHDYADNAQYWLGEAYYDQKDYPRAVTEFRATVSAYPLGNKVPDALLKIGLAYAALGEPAKARAALEQVIQKFPKSAPAVIAATRLGEMP